MAQLLWGCVFVLHFPVVSRFRLSIRVPTLWALFALCLIGSASAQYVSVPTYTVTAPGGTPFTATGAGSGGSARTAAVAAWAGTLTSPAYDGGGYGWNVNFGGGSSGYTAAGEECVGSSGGSCSSQAYFPVGVSCSGGGTYSWSSDSCSGGSGGSSCSSSNFGTAAGGTNPGGGQDICPSNGCLMSSSSISSNDGVSWNGTGYQTGATCTGGTGTWTSASSPAVPPPPSCPSSSAAGEYNGQFVCIPNSGSSPITTVTSGGTTTTGGGATGAGAPPTGGGGSTTEQSTSTCASGGTCAQSTTISGGGGTTTTTSTGVAGGAGGSGSGTTPCGGSGDDCNVKIDETGTIDATTAGAANDAIGNAAVGTGGSMDTAISSVNSVGSNAVPGDGGAGGSGVGVDMTTIAPPADSGSCPMDIELFPGHSSTAGCAVLDISHLLFQWFWGAGAVLYVWRRGHDAIQAG